MNQISLDYLKNKRTLTLSSLGQRSSLVVIHQRSYSSTSSSLSVPPSLEKKIQLDSDGVPLPQPDVDKTTELIADLPPSPIAPDLINTLTNSVPVQTLQETLELIHNSTGLPWSLTIVCCTIAFRILLFPLVYHQSWSIHRLNISWPHVNHMNMVLGKSLDKVRVGDNKSIFTKVGIWAKGISATLKFHDAKIFQTILTPFIQIPIFMTFAFANRRMIATGVDGMDQGGFAWFIALTEADPTCILPMLAVFSTYMNIQNGFSKLPPNANLLFAFKDNIQLLLILGLPMTASLPSGVFCYWITNSLLGHGMYFGMKNDKFRQVMGLPALPKKNLVNSREDSPTSDKVNSISSSLSLSSDMGPAQNFTGTSDNRLPPLRVNPEDMKDIIQDIEKKISRKKNIL